MPQVDHQPLLKPLTQVWNGFGGAGNDGSACDNVGLRSDGSGVGGDIFRDGESGGRLDMSGGATKVSRTRQRQPAKGNCCARPKPWVLHGLFLARQSEVQNELSRR